MQVGFLPSQPWESLGMRSTHVGDYALFAVGSSQALKEEWAQMCTESCTALEEVSHHLDLSLFVLSSLIILLSVLVCVLIHNLPFLHPIGLIVNLILTFNPLVSINHLY